MIPDIRQLLEAEPFVSFSLYLIDGGRADVPSADNLFVFPQGTRVIIVNDEDGYEIIPAENITRIVVDPRPHTPPE